MFQLVMPMLFQLVIFMLFQLVMSMLYQLVMSMLFQLDMAMLFQFVMSMHSSKILTIQQGITRGVSSVGKPCRPEHGFPRPNCPGNAPIFQKYVLCVTV